MSRIFIAGCGYVGKKLAHRLHEKNHVSVSVRSAEKLTNLLKTYTAYQIDLDDIKSFPKIDFSNTLVFYFIPPPSAGVRDKRIDYFLTSLDKSSLPKKIILISTTGVYGDCGNEWVKETRVAKPDSDRGKRRLDAELTLEKFCKKEKIPYVILRIPGIYGADNLPLKRLIDRKPVLSLSESPWSNRIHVDDLIRACIRCIDYSGNINLFNISDGQPGSMTDYFLQVARSRGIPEPPQITMKECENIFSANMMSYLKESKKIDNSLMINELGVKLMYPNLEKGLEIKN